MNNGGPAFPECTWKYNADLGRYVEKISGGMSLRDWFAGQALISLGNSNPNLPGDPADRLGWPDAKTLAERRAKWAYLHADAMLAAREEQHPDDAAVDRFAAAMKEKLARSRANGRGGWNDPAQCSVEFLASLLIGHIGKGNPGNFEDIANLAMMLHQRGADPSILATHAPDAGAEAERIRVADAMLTAKGADHG